MKIEAALVEGRELGASITHRRSASTDTSHKHVLENVHVGDLTSRCTSPRFVDPFTTACYAHKPHVEFMMHFIDIKGQSDLRVANASVPVCCLPSGLSVGDHTVDSLALVDIDIAEGLVTGICSARGTAVYPHLDGGIVDLRHGMVLPTFVDLHTHIGQSHANSGGLFVGAYVAPFQDICFSVPISN